MTREGGRRIGRRRWCLAETLDEIAVQVHPTEAIAGGALGSPSYVPAWAVRLPRPATPRESAPADGRAVPE